MNKLLSGMVNVFFRWCCTGFCGMDIDSPSVPIVMPRKRIQPAHPTFFFLISFFIFTLTLITPYSVQAANTIAKFAYVVNSTSSTVSIYTIDSLTGALRHNGYVTAGTSAQSITVHPSEKFAYVANYNSANVSVYTINQTTGALTAGTAAPAGTHPVAVTIDPTGKFAYVANEGSSSVSAFTIDQSSGVLTAGTTVATGSSPRSVTVDPSGKFAYVANRDSDTVSVYTINQTTGALTTGTALVAGTKPYWLTVDPSGRFAYVVNYNSANVSIYTINQTTGALTAGTAVAAGTNPISVAVDPFGKFAYVANYGSGNVSVYTINQSTGALTEVGTPVAAGINSYAITVDPSGTFAYVANAGSNTVSIFSINQTTGALTLSKTISAQQSPVSIALLSGSAAVSYVPKFAYTANSSQNNVSVYTISPDTGALTAGSAVAGGSFPYWVTADTTGRFAYVANTNSNNVSVYTINQTTGALTAGTTVAAGSHPQSVNIDPNGKFAYVANAGSNSVMVYSIDQSTGALTSVTSATAGGNPNMVAIDPSGRFAFVPNYVCYKCTGSVSVYTINPATGALTAGTAVTAGQNPVSVSVDPSGRFAYASNNYSNDVSVYTIDQSTGALTAGTSVAAGSRPGSVTVDSTGKFAYVANGVSNDVSVYSINQTTGALTAVGSPVAVGSGPLQVTIDPSGKFAYVGNVASSNVSVFTINTTNGTLTEITGSPFSTGSGPGPYSVAVSGSISSADLTSGLVAWYPFTGNANDASGNGNNGTVSGATLTTDGFGNANSSYDFNGSSNYISVPPADSLKLKNEITLSAWVNFSGGTSGNPGSVNPRIIEFGPDTEKGYGLYTLSASASRVMAFGYGGIGIGSTTVLPENQWHLVTGVGTLSSVKIYIDGVLDGTAVGAPSGFNYSSPLTIGRKPIPAYDAYGGKIDDLRIYNRALSASEVQALYNQAVPTTFNLTLTKSGTGTGAVTVNSGIINWSTNTGTANYTSGSVVTLTATPDSESAFTGWSGDCTGSGTCQVTMSAAKSVTATFSDVTAPNAPTVTSLAALTNNSKPTWSWTTGGNGGNGTYRYKMDSSDLTSGATEATLSSLTPGTALPDGAHTLYVQERDTAGNWSVSGYVAVTVDTAGPAGGIGQAQFSPIANMAIERKDHNSVLLQNGKVLVVGGQAYPTSPPYNFLKTTELYDPATNAFSAGGTMSEAHEGGAAILLANGKVLVVSGQTVTDTWTKTVELYNPATNTWSAGAPISTARQWFAATLLPNGNVLVAGGQTSNGDNYTASAEIYDPVADSWSTVPAMTVARGYSGAVLLQNGKVMVAGGTTNNGSATAITEIYDPITTAWSSGGSMTTPHSSLHNTPLVLLQNGKILAAGGAGTSNILSSSELYDPSANTWSAAANLPAKRLRYAAMLLPNGNVLLSGGDNGVSFVNGIYNDALIYNVTANSWTSAGTMSVARCVHTASLLADGRVLITGGISSGNTYVASAELYTPAYTAITINSSATTTNTITVALTLSATDPSGVTGMKISNLADLSDASEIASATSKTWTLTTGDGLKTVYVTFKDSVGNWSQVYSAAITLDSTYTVAFTAGTGGTLAGTTTQNVSSGGSTTAVTAVPNTGYHFVNWTGTGGFVPIQPTRWR